MKRRDVLVFGLAAATILFTASCKHGSARPDPSRPSASATAGTNAAQPEASAEVGSKPVYVPDTTLANQPLPEGVLAWNMPLATTNVPASEEKARFTFVFTNISSANVTLLRVTPGCGCTTAELPGLPWTIPAGASGTIPVTVDLVGKSGILFKNIAVVTDKGSKDIYMRITMEAVKMREITDAEREKFVTMTKADRQAIFKGECADCHVKHGEGKYGKALYDADCAICHEAEHRATMVPDLHNLKVPTNPDFWKQWIAHGKAGSLMAAFSEAEGGPLNDLQVTSLVAYLNETIPSKVESPQ